MWQNQLSINVFYIRIFKNEKKKVTKTEYISGLLKCNHTDQDKEVPQCSETINVYIN